MKCISIQAPWAWLILLGLKPIENRKWFSRHRGDLLIHIGKKYDVGAGMCLSCTPAFKDDVDKYLKFCDGRETKLPLGVIAGKVTMTGCVTTHASPYFFGPYGHVYKDPVMFKDPIPYKGKLGTFDVPDEALIIDGKCSVCGELLIYPRGGMPYCQDCGWPDEYFGPPPRTCRVCGCTDDDCRGCIEKTGKPCWWVEEDMCSACVTISK